MIYFYKNRCNLFERQVNLIKKYKKDDYYKNKQNYDDLGGASRVIVVA